MEVSNRPALSDLARDDTQPQYTVPPNVWFGSVPTKDYTISPDGTVLKAASRDVEKQHSPVGCTCVRVFQFQDFELARRSELLSRFPNLEPMLSILNLPDR